MFDCETPRADESIWTIDEGECVDGGVIHILDVDDISSSQEALIIHYLSFFLVYTDSYCTCLLSASWLLISIEWQQPASAAQWRGLELSSEYHKLVFQSRRLFPFILNALDSTDWFYQPLTNLTTKYFSYSVLDLV